MFKLVLAITLLGAVLCTPAQDPRLEAGCSVSSYNDVAAAVKSCTTLTLTDIDVPASTTLDLELQSGTTLNLAGTFKFGVANWAGPLMKISGSKVTVNGNGVVLDGRGAQYWDGKGGSGSTKPKFLKITTTGGSTLSGITVLNCPIQCVSVSSSDTVIQDFTLEVTAGDTAGGHNTDGFDVSSSTGLTIKNSVIKNQDDCVAVNQGSNMLFQNLTCSGGHGLSLSVGQSSDSGSKNQVSNITFSDSTVMNSDNGIHVKTHTDAGTGYIKDVTYSNIKLSGIRKYGINVQEDYANGGSTGTAKNNIPITNLKLTGVTGSMSGDSSSMPVYIFCADGGCNSWTWSGVSVSNGKKSSSCNFTPSGFSC